MAWQKNKILLVSTVVDDKGIKRMHRYVKNKSKGTGKAATPGKKLTLRKFNPTVNRYTIYTETKYK
jgi:ribosomal protein L33